MKYKGINYDTGTTTITGILTREIFNPDIVVSEMQIIKNELHCNAVRISGVYIERVVEASEIALKEGLQVLFSASLSYENQERTLEFILQSSAAAETLRHRYNNVIFVLGCELSLFTYGFIKGDSGQERMKNLFSPLSLLKNMLGMPRYYNHRLNRFISKAIGGIRKTFKGLITYASGTWEKIDWRKLDIIGSDLYRSAFNKKIYSKELRRFKQIGKPFIVTEFGCCAYQGADEKGAAGWAIVDWSQQPSALTGDYKRDESVQSTYLLGLLDIFEKENIEGAFVFTFISYNYLFNEDPKYDLDMASFGIVRAMPDTSKGYFQNMPWIPKQAFYELSNYFKSH